MATLPQTKTVTYEEWLEMPQVEDAIEEVVNGEIRIMPPAKWKHAYIVERLRRALDARFNPDEVLVVTANFGLIVRREPLTSRVPDIAVFRLGSMVEQDGYIHSPPQLVVEVLSPANRRRHMQLKLADYEALGVPEVWIAAPEGETVEVLRLESGRLRRIRILAEGTLEPAEFPGAGIDIASIWPS